MPQGWEKWIIPLILLGGWILSHLLRNKQENGRPPARTRNDEAAASSVRRSSEEVDRFLQEVRRRKKPEQPRERKPTRTADRPRPTPPPIAPAREALPVMMAQPVLPRRPEAEAILVAEILDVPVALSQPVAAGVVTHATDTPAVQLIKNLLRSRQNLAAAIILKEVLDQPRCKRPRRD